MIKRWKAMVWCVGAAGMLVAGAAGAEAFNLRIGSGHPSGPTVYVYDVEKFFVPEVVKRVKERTGHTITFTEAYGAKL